MSKQSKPPPNPSGPLFIDERELSRRTTISRTTLQVMRREGGGPPFAKLGGAVLYQISDVEAWIVANTHTKAPSAVREVAP